MNFSQIVDFVKFAALHDDRDTEQDAISFTSNKIISQIENSVSLYCFGHYKFRIDGQEN